jgi:hypothetical protein
MASREEVVGLLALGFILGGLAVLPLPSESSSGTTEVSFDQLNLSHRDIGLNTGSGDRLECGVSRFNEVQISENNYVYRNSSCTSWINVNGSTVTLPVKGDVLFDADGIRIGFDVGDQYVVCDVSEEMEEKTGESSYVYSGAECEAFAGGLYGKWNDPEFENFNVYERGQELLKNQTEN